MIREVNGDDAPDLAELMRQLGATPPVTASEIATIRAKITQITKLDHLKIFGFEQAGNLVGTCTLGRVEGLSNGCRPFAIIENVVVLATIRRQGIGQQLVCHAIAQAEQWGCYKVILETGTKTEWKLHFYEECGLTSGSKTAFIKRFA
ncbi:MAG: GNAT family N-acetyltransferase [Caldilineaceae bacterium]|nr:GNAT family N-acetyltransferase [Caldilineaceae bacterium]